MLKWDHWHIEPSSICALKCPRCPRAEVPETLLNQQLSLSFFQTQIGEDTIRSIQKITFCGNDGDPIYCRDLLDICRWIKSINKDIHLVLVTNGGYKPRSWWESLASIFDDKDEIHWSIDGWDQHSNQQYRVNSDWLSIVEGILEFKQRNQTTYTVWAAIAFSFNENFLQKMQNQARDWGIDLFQITKSTKFGSFYPAAYGNNDPLQSKKQSVFTT